MSKQTWYVKLSTGPAGPLAPSHLKKLAASGLINRETPVRLAGGSKGWTEASHVKGLFESDTQKTHDLGSLPETDSEISLPRDQAEHWQNEIPTWLTFTVGLTIGSVLVGGFLVFGLALIENERKESLQAAQQAAVTESALEDEVKRSRSPSIPENNRDFQPLGLPGVADFTGKNWTPQSAKEVEGSLETRQAELELNDPSSAGLNDSKETASLTARQIAKNLKESTVTIRVKLDKGHSLGSGFLVESDRTVITCLHVVKGAREIDVLISGGQTVPCHLYQAFSEAWDLVVLRTAKPLGKPLLPLASNSPEQGDPVYAYGAPEGLFGTLSTGIVSAIRDGGESPFALDAFRPEGLKLIQFTAAASSGSSGGPLVNGSGHVIGVVASKWSTADDANFAVDISHLASLLQRAGNGSESLISSLPERPEIVEGPDADEVAAAAERVADELKKQREEREKERIAFETIADARKKEAERRTLLQGIEADLSKANIALQRVKAEGNALVNRERQIQSEGQAILSRGMQVKQRIQITRGHIRGVEIELLNRQAAAQQGKQYIGDPRSTEALSQDLQRLRLELFALQAEARPLEEAYVALDQEARSLQDQIIAKQHEHDMLQSAVQDLEQRKKVILYGPQLTWAQQRAKEHQAEKQAAKEARIEARLQQQRINEPQKP